MWPMRLQMQMSVLDVSRFFVFVFFFFEERHKKNTSLSQSTNACEWE